jgi:pimeloyl-ACP methyl ester carboxylesterase
MSNTTSSSRAKKASTDPRLWKWGAAAAAGTALAGTALLNLSRARGAERDNPPLGKFVTVDGVRLHYVERGTGPDLVLLHGNGTMIEDWEVSGVLDALAKTHRVIAFDRPGFGHSERPRSVIWTPTAQAALLAKAFSRLRIHKPLVVGHSFGTMVAMALALNHSASVSGLALLAGYYFPSARADVLFASQPAIPVVGDVMRYTVSPLMGAALIPVVNKRIFAPAPVTESWENGFPFDMSLRPSQIRAEAAEAALMIPAAAAVAGRYGELDLPVTIIAGPEDKMVSMEDQSERLHDEIRNSRLVQIKEAGHMIHHTATAKVVSAIKGS